MARNLLTKPKIEFCAMDKWNGFILRFELKGRMQAVLIVDDDLNRYIDPMSYDVLKEWLIDHGARFGRAFVPETEQGVKPGCHFMHNDDKYVICRLDADLLGYFNWTKGRLDFICDVSGMGQREYQACMFKFLRFKEGTLC